jgi:hypothetical protein
LKFVAGSWFALGKDTGLSIPLAQRRSAWFSELSDNRVDVHAVWPASDETLMNSPGQSHRADDPREGRHDAERLHAGRRSLRRAADVVGSELITIVHKPEGTAAPIS